MTGCYCIKPQINELHKKAAIELDITYTTQMSAEVTAKVAQVWQTPGL